MSVEWDAALDYIRAYHPVDPHQARVLRHRVGRPLHSEADWPKGVLATHSFHLDFWSAHGIRAMVATRVAEDERRTVVAVVLRSRDQRSFSPQDVAFVGRCLALWIAHRSQGPPRPTRRTAWRLPGRNGRTAWCALWDRGFSPCDRAATGRSPGRQSGSPAAACR